MENNHERLLDSKGDQERDDMTILTQLSKQHMSTATLDGFTSPPTMKLGIVWEKISSHAAQVVQGMQTSWHWRQRMSKAHASRHWRRRRRRRRRARYLICSTLKIFDILDAHNLLLNVQNSRCCRMEGAPVPHTLPPRRDRPRACVGVRIRMICI